jgi:uncharacterized membrane protein YphA (DoxX/SURF4 family)
MLIARILLSSFLAVLFLQSGLDKVFDRTGNQSYLKTHFAKSPLARFSGPLFWGITALEVAAGALCALGVLQLVFAERSTLAYYGALTACVAILGLFGGQRLAKDYEGAAVLVPYFLAAITALLILQPVSLKLRW